MRRLAGFLPLLAPLVVAAVMVGIGQIDLDRPAEPVWDPPPLPPVSVDPLPAARERSVLVLDASGGPAPDALVVQLEPSLGSARTGADGRALLRTWSAGPLRVMAWAPGHEVFGPASFDEPPPEGLRLAALRHPTLPPREVRVETERSVRLVRRDDGTPVAAALVLARPATEHDAPPSLAFSDAQGVATLRGLVEGAVLFEAFAPGLPPVPAWRLGAGTGPELSLSCAELVLEDLPAGAILAGERLDEPSPLPSRLVPEDGRLLLGPLPPGSYRLRCAGREWVVPLEAG